MLLGGLGFSGKGTQHLFKLRNQIVIRQLATIDIEVIEKVWNAEAANDLAIEKWRSGFSKLQYGISATWPGRRGEHHDRLVTVDVPANSAHPIEEVFKGYREITIVLSKGNKNHVRLFDSGLEGVRALRNAVLLFQVDAVGCGAAIDGAGWIYTGFQALGRTDFKVLSTMDSLRLCLKLSPSAQTLACCGNNLRHCSTKIELYFNQLKFTARLTGAIL